MNKKINEFEKSPFEEAKKEFSKACSLDDATKLVWNRPNAGIGMYQRYTTIDNVLNIIKERRWWLSRGDIQNDLHEAKRSKEIDNKMRRTYLMCLMRGAGENVAMWSLYGNKDPLAIRISIPKVSIEDKWVNPIVNGLDFNVQTLDGKNIKRECIKELYFRDLIYIAVRDKKVLDEYDIRRTNTISWEGAKANLKDDSLFKASKEERFAGWIKDYEWNHERETRLCLCLHKKIEDRAISISIPDEVLADMRFTFSPWLRNKKIEKAIESEICQAYQEVGVKIKKRPQRFRRSVLQGMLNF